jgi:hypothetical protein
MKVIESDGKLKAKVRKQRRTREQGREQVRIIIKLITLFFGGKLNILQPQYCKLFPLLSFPSIRMLTALINHLFSTTDFPHCVFIDKLMKHYRRTYFKTVRRC